MACWSPLTGYRTAAGKVTFDRRKGYYDKPVTIACGQCSGCRLERSRQWAVRCMHEASQHADNSFVTLTYDSQNLPSTGGLVLKHWQTFAKRLRHKAGPFRFYHCGEYGDDTGRPHYHALLFGLDFRADRKHHKTLRGNPLYTSETLTDTWGKGHCVIGELTYESAAYVARYCMKKVNGKKAEAHYQTVDTRTGEVHQVKPEYTTMSRRPGIGKTWFDKYASDVFPSDEVIVNGKSARPPRYYDTQLDSAELDRIKVKRRAQARPHRDNNTPERLLIRQTIQELRSKQFQRDLG